MNYNILEKYLEDSKYEELLEIYKEDLERAEEYSNLFTNNALISPHECQEALETLTGLYMKFNTIYNIAEYQYEKKKQLSKLTTGDKDSLMTIACLRVKTIFKSYMNNARKGISSCQSLLRYYIKEMELIR